MKSSPPSLAPAILGSLGVLFSLSAPLCAQETGDMQVSGSEAAVEVRVGAVIASNSGKEFDRRLASLHQQFDSLFPYSSYRLVMEEKRRIAWGGKAGFDIPGGRYVMVVPREFKNDRVSMKVTVIEGARSIIDTTLSLPDHGTFLLGGPRHANGVLIVAIGADRIR